MITEPTLYRGTALPIEDDVMIVIPDEFDFKPGDEVEATRRGDGVVELRRLVPTTQK